MEREPLGERDLQAQRDFAVVQLAQLERRGAELHSRLLESTGGHDRGALGVWQQDCAAAIHQLAGGSKAHWLSRAFSDALLIKSDDGTAVVEADPEAIVLRIIEVLARARQSLFDMDEVVLASTASPAVHRFDFVHNASLRPVLESAYEESGRAFDQRDFTQSLITSCSVIESLLTDALEHRGSEISALGFAERIAAAEQAGLIRGGCARLPPVARVYRDSGSPSTLVVTARDAKVARQVLHVVMRDLNPGR